MRPLYVLLLAAGLPLNHAAAQNITGIQTVDNASATSAAWDHQVQTGPVSVSGNAAHFRHTARFANTAQYSGGVAQVQGRRSAFTLSFTVEDPASAGFDVDIDQLLRGYSSVTSQSGTGNATGVSYFVQSATNGDPLQNNIPLFISTPGTSATGAAGAPPVTETVLGQNSETVSLGSFTGTTSFTLDYTTNFSPTTNVFFANGGVGSGSVNYGLGTLPDGVDFTAGDLGHFVDVRVTYVPEPASLSLLGLGGLAALRRRRPHNA